YCAGHKGAAHEETPGFFVGSSHGILSVAVDALAGTVVRSYKLFSYRGYSRLNLFNRFRKLTSN
ncbi:MAG UNVERIFIED_CONTAM: hypothetical protein LVR29_24060, partial [Microcystis novacekii LVE1205-3]